MVATSLKAAASGNRPLRGASLATPPAFAGGSGNMVANSAWRCTVLKVRSASSWASSRLNAGEGGNDRREVFRDERDRERFLEAAGEMAGRFGAAVFGYCLMPNHGSTELAEVYHLLLGTPRGNLSRAMQWLQGTYTARFNRRHRRADGAAGVLRVL